MNILLQESHYIGHPLYMENKLMYCFSDRIAQMYQTLSSESNLNLQKVLQQIPNLLTNPHFT